MPSVVKTRALLAALLLLGCSDPLIGEWKEVDALCTADGEFTVDDDLTVEGTFYIPDGTGYCLECEFDGDLTLGDDGEYSGEITFETCECGDDPTADFECTMNGAEDELDCTLRSADCADVDTEWKRQ